MDLVAKLASLEAGLDKAGRLAEKQASQIERAFSGVRVAAAGLGGVIAGAFSVVAMQQFFMTAVNGIDALNDLSDATGASIENISALEDVALRTGTSYETVSTALVKLNGVLKDAKPGSAQAEALNAIGLGAEELKRIDPAEAMLKVAQALAQYRDDGNKARIIQELFGKSTKEVAPLLKDLAEQGKLVGTVTKEQAEAAEAFNKQLAALQKNTADWARSIASDLLPVLNTFLERLNGLSKAGGVGKSIGLEIDANLLTDRLNAVVRDIERFQAYVDKNPNSNARFRLAQLREEYVSLQAQLDKTTGALKQFGDTAKPVPSVEDAFSDTRTPKPAAPGVRDKPEKGPKPPKAEKPEFVGPELPEATKAALDALAGSDLEKAKQITAAIEELDSMFAAGLVNAQDYAAAIDKLRGNAAVGPALPEEEVARIKRVRDLISETDTAKLESFRREVKLLEDAMSSGMINPEQFEEAKKILEDKLPKTFKDSTDKMTAFAEEAAKNIQDALGDTILQAMEGDFDSIGESWKRMLNRMVSEALAADINNALFHGGKPSFSGVFGQAGGQGSNGLVDLLGSLGTFFGAENPRSAFAVNGSDFGFKLAKGTNYVPYDDMPAILHKGEAVVPAKYNPAAGGMGVSEALSADLGALVDRLGHSALLPSYDVGTPYVPEDQIAKVHRGERIVPAAQNRAGEWGGTVIHSNPSIYIDGRLDHASTAQLINQALQANNRAWEERMAAQGRR